MKAAGLLHPEGRLNIELACRANAVERVTIQSGRPLRVSRVMENTPTDEALRRIPLVFSVCATAQCEAALAACEQALGHIPTPAHQHARAMLVAMETAREHLLRILLDWTGFIGEDVPGAHLPQLMRLLPGLRRALYGEANPFLLHARPHIDFAALADAIDALRSMNALVLGGDGDPCASPLRSRSAFEDWVARGETLPARLLRDVRARRWERLGHGGSVWLPRLEADTLRRRLAGNDHEDFIAAPHWQDTPCETTALARQRTHPLVADLLETEGSGLLTRLAARLVELERIPQSLTEDMARLRQQGDPAVDATASGVGLAQVEAARGRLVHYVEITDGMVQRFRILAPTEWNFHPQGVAARGLMTLDGGDEETLQRQGALWINAIDPCVGFTLRRTEHA